MKIANYKIVKEVTKHGKELAKYMSKNSPVLLTGCAVAGAFMAVGLAIKATKPALEHIKEEKIAHRDRIVITDGDTREDMELTQEEIDTIQLKPTEVVKAVWKDYIPTGIALLGTSACIIGAHSISAKRTAAMAALYTMSENALKEYKDKAEEIVGKGKAQKIQDEVTADKVARTPPDDTSIIITGKGNTLCFEPITSRYFRSDAETIRKAMNDLNARMFNGDFRISLNEWFYEIGLDGTAIGDEMGWSTEAMIDLNLTSSLTSRAEPCLVVGHRTMPYPWYQNC